MEAGTALVAQRQYDKAMAKFVEAASLAANDGNALQEACALTNMASVQHMKGEFEVAVDLFKCVRSCRCCAARHFLIMCVCVCSCLCRKALRSMETLGEVHRQAHIWLSLTLSQFALLDAAAAEAAFAQFLKLETRPHELAAAKERYTEAKRIGAC